MGSSTVRIAVIPAAGRGTRFLPATKVIPKEMMPVAGRPIIQFAVEEAAASGLETVILVLRRGKEVVAEHFQSGGVLERTNPQPGNAWSDPTAALRHLSQLVDVRTVWQEAPLGLADAVRAAQPVIHDEPFAVILPDALIDSAIPCTRQLMDCYAQYSGCVIATQLVDSEEVDRFGILDLVPIHNSDNGGRTMKVTSLVERPRVGSVSSRYGIFGRYILEPGIFESIRHTYPGLNGELHLTDALMVHTGNAPVYGYQFVGTHYDAGSKLGFVEATLGYALKDPEIASMLRKRLARGTFSATTPVV
jgi:UTP--glucose-1-phosphate uridylyltransferase